MERSTSKRLKPNNVKDRYDMDCLVGEGAFGYVWKAKDKQTKQPVAIKIFKKGKDGEGVSFTICREIALLRELNHENIVHLQDVFIEQNKELYLVFEYAEYDLLEILRSHRERLKKTLPEGTIKSMLWQLLNGINYLHSNWIIHRDLKPSNILVMGGKGIRDKDVGILKIADFGLARVYQGPVRPLADNGVVVTIWYRAPELLLGAKHYTKAIDIWAIGCIFAELVNCKPLFPGEERPPKVFQDDQMLKIMKVLGTISPEAWPDVVRLPDWDKVQGWEKYPNALHKSITTKNILTSDGFDLLQKMLHYDPNARISARDALAHPYFSAQPVPTANCFAFISKYEDYYPPRKDQNQKKKEESVPPIHHTSNKPPNRGR